MANGSHNHLVVSLERAAKQVIKHSNTFELSKVGLEDGWWPEKRPKASQSMISYLTRMGTWHEWGQLIIWYLDGLLHMDLQSLMRTWLQAESH